MTVIKNVIVVGATGHTGSCVLEALQAHPEFAVSILTRDSSTTKHHPPHKIQVITADYTSLESLTAALTGQDAVVSTISRDYARDQQIIIDAAINAGVKRFIPSEFGANTLGKAGELAIFQGKSEIRKYLEKKAAEGKITWTGIANGPALDTSLKAGVFGFNSAEKKVVLFDGGNNRFSTTLSATIGAAVPSVLKHPEATENKYLYIQSICTTQREVLALYEKLTDTKWEVEEKSTEELEKATNERLAKGDRSTSYNLLYRCCYAEGYGNEFKDLSNGILGLPQLDVEGLEEVLKSTL